MVRSNESLQPFPDAYSIWSTNFCSKATGSHFFSPKHYFKKHCLDIKHKSLASPKEFMLLNSSDTSNNYSLCYPVRKPQVLGKRGPIISRFKTNHL